MSIQEVMNTVGSSLRSSGTFETGGVFRLEGCSDWRDVQTLKYSSN